MGELEAIRLTDPAIAAVVAAIGVGVMLVAQRALLRLAGVLAAGGGAVALGLLITPRIETVVSARGALVFLYGAGALAALIVAASVFVRLPWLVVPAVIAVAWIRLTVSLGEDERVQLLVPVYGVIAAAAVAYAWECLRGKRPEPRLGAVGWALALWLVVAAASLTWAIDPRRAAIAMVAFHLPFGVLAAMIGSLRDLDHRPRLAAAVQLTLATGFAVFGGWQWLNEEIVWNPKVYTANALGPFFRVNSVFYDPSVFGRYEALALVTIVGALALGAASRWSPVAAVLAIPIAAGLFLSYSQSSMLALLAGITAIVAFGWRRLSLIVVAVVAVAAVAVALAVPSTRAALTGNANQFTSDRLALARYGLDAFAERPVLGAGLNNFGEATGRTKGQKRVRAPHTAPIGVAAELGVAGLIAASLLLLTIVWRAARPIDPGYRRGFRLVVAALLVAIGTHSLFYNALFEDPASWAVVALLAMLAGTRKPEVEPQEPQEPEAEPGPDPPEATEATEVTDATDATDVSPATSA